MSKPRSLTPLETIYEESGSFIASTSSSQNIYKDETINGLISARSMPPINIQQQRTVKNQPKPPIEVRFRDGSKRYIQPSTTMIMNRRDLLNSSHNNLSSKKISNSNPQQIIQSNFNKNNFQIKPPLVFTIITIEDLRQAGVKSTVYSSSDESNISSPMITPIKHIHQISPKQLPSVQRTSPLRNTSQQQVIINHAKNLIVPSPASTDSFVTKSTQLPSVSNSQLSTSSYRVTLTNDENERSLNNKAVNQTVQPNTLTLGPSKVRSAFRPFLKSLRFNQETSLIKPRIIPIDNRKSFNPTQQQAVQPTSTTYNSFRPSIKPNNVVVPKYSMVPTRIKFDVTKNPSLNNNSLIKMNSSIYQQPSKLINNSLNLPHILDVSPNSGQNFSFSVDPNMQWFNITSNSIYDIPHLSSKYSRIPLRITLPVVSPTQNQKFLNKHNAELEKRLLNAGLSPETIALYERILEVADSRPMNIRSTSKIINQNPYKSLNRIFL